MKIFAISDLHLSLTERFDFTNPQNAKLSKPMDIFGLQWEDFFSRLSSGWCENVSAEDTVLIPGDISWAMHLPETEHDFAYIDSLPGKKIISRGNHDFWWEGIGKLRSYLPASISALQHDAVEVGEYAVCATRGWLSPTHNDFKESLDRKIYERELLRLEMALESAASLSKPIIVMLHFPPIDNMDAKKADSGFAELLAKYPVHSCVYGHIHGSKTAAFEGEYQGILFRNVSVDRVNFQPLLIAKSS